MVQPIDSSMSGSLNLRGDPQTHVDLGTGVPIQTGSPNLYDTRCTVAASPAISLTNLLVLSTIHVTNMEDKQQTQISEKSI